MPPPNGTTAAETNHSGDGARSGDRARMGGHPTPVSSTNAKRSSCTPAEQIEHTDSPPTATPPRRRSRLTLVPHDRLPRPRLVAVAANRSVEQQREQERARSAAIANAGPAHSPDHCRQNPRAPSAAAEAGHDASSRGDQPGSCASRSPPRAPSATDAPLGEATEALVDSARRCVRRTACGNPSVNHSPATTTPCRRWRSTPTARCSPPPAADGTVRLWNPASGEPVGEPLTGHDGTVYEWRSTPTALCSPPPAPMTGAVVGSRHRRPVGEPLTGHTDAVTGGASAPTDAARIRRRR